MKNKTWIAAAVVLAMAWGLGSAEMADAGWFSKDGGKKRTEKTDEEQTPRRFDDLPSMTFKGGTLVQDAYGSWMVGETPVVLASDCVITEFGQDSGQLKAGRHATVMGPLVGGTIQAWSVYVGPPQYTSLGVTQESEELREPGADPNVGRIVSPQD